MAEPVGGAAEAAVLALLTGPDARELLGLALGTAGVGVTGHVVHDVQHRPGDGVTVGYRVWVSGAAAGAGDVPPTEEYVLVSSTAGRDVPDDAPSVARIEGPEGRLLAWLHPDDPALPALRAGCDPVLLEDVLPGSGPVTDLELVGYRPLRRAVVRAVRDDRTWWVKVLRPRAGRGGAPDVLHRHEVLRDAGLPVPRVAASTPDGLVVLEHLPGRPLVAAIGEDDARGLEVTHLVEVLDALPADAVDLPRRSPWSDRAAAYAAAVAAAGPDGERARAVAAEVVERSARLDLGPVVTTHGDFHEGQLTVDPTPDGWRVAGLLDVDTVGPGHRVDDLACLVAHAIAIGPPGEWVARRWEAAARALADPAVLDVRTAGVLLSLAAGAAHGRGPTPPTHLLDAAEERLAR
ncbi:phosphotransferase family protein [Oryzobacter telluris]|uniref:phosphotransferase family protein n=1 Tax=Oryzobacter telluris TaxID=3149179 RepID=UPI00370D272B